MLYRLKLSKNEKGQGLTEYALILAFLAILAFMMFGGNGSLLDTMKYTITNTNRIFAELFNDGMT